jgi:hypothetical protein
MSRLFPILLIIAAACGTAFWLGLRPWEGRTSKTETTLKKAPSGLPDYSVELSAIERRRTELSAALAENPSEPQRAEILTEAQSLLQKSLTRDLPAHWLGTPWDFNGTSQTPGEGQIACGYFVSTLLRDAGFGVERIRLAQQPSGNIIRTLTERQNITRLVGKPFEEFRSKLRDRGNGVFVIGLDRHVGIIAQTDEGAAFIHSDGGRNKCVIVEPVETSPALLRSNWREFANLSNDHVLLEKWLRGEQFPTVL